MEYFNNNSDKIPILSSSNFSLNINLLFCLIDVLSKQLNNIDYAIIEEEHHKSKKDSPSGTSINMKHIIEDNMNIKCSIDSYNNNIIK